MKTKLLVVSLALMLLPIVAMAETWQNAALIDNSCATKVKANPDAHTRECMLQCQRAGYGIVTADGNYLKLDANGNAQALTLLKSAKQNDHIRVTVTGVQQGDTIKVESIKM